MKKFHVLALVATLSSSLFAHNLWVDASNSDVLKADMIYGHSFPAPESIAPERVKLFDDIKVYGQNYNQTLKQKGENYHFEGEALKNGAYIVHAYYKPMAWSKKADGKWEMGKTRKDIKAEVTYCGVSTMSSKRILIVGDDKGEFASKPMAKGLEFVPLSNASEFKAGEVIKFKLLKDNKPVKTNKVFGTYAGYSKADINGAFYSTTDLNGEFEFKAPVKGLWAINTKLNSDSKNPDCETFNDNASIVFEVK